MIMVLNGYSLGSFSKQPTLRVIQSGLYEIGDIPSPAEVFFVFQLQGMVNEAEMLITE